MSNESTHADDTENGSIFGGLCKLLLGDLDKRKQKQRSSETKSRGAESDDKIHIVIEAAHSDQLGRPANLVLDELLRERVIADDPSIKVHFIEDRVRIPENLQGHIVCIGGPRSNVIARAALEYEMDFQLTPPMYRRINAPSLHHPIKYIANGKSINDVRFDIDDPVFDRIRKEFPGYTNDLVEELIANLEQAHGFDEKKVRAPVDQLEHLNPYALKLYRLYSPGRFFLVADGEPGSDQNSIRNRAISLREMPELLVPQEPDSMDDINVRLKKLEENSKSPRCADLLDEDMREYLVYDHLAFTLMPNVFSKNWEEDRLLIYHGLRSLGTLASLRLVRDDNHLKDIKNLLSQSKKTWKTGQTSDDGKKTDTQQMLMFQILWSIYRGTGGQALFSSTNRKEHLDWRPKNESNIKLLHGIEKAPEKSAKVSSGQAFAYVAPKQRVELFSESMRGKSDTGRSVKKALVKINQIDADQVLGAMALQRDRSFRRDGVYVLGCFENTKTVYTQQARAYTLIHALHKSGELSPGKKIAIVGGGASGIAAAIAAIQTGVRTVLVHDHSELMYQQASADHRYIHPYAYDWPNLLRQNAKSDLPWLKWKADNAVKVRAEIIGFLKNIQKETFARYSDQNMFQIFPNYRVKRYFYDIKKRRHCIGRRTINELSQLHKTNPPPPLSNPENEFDGIGKYFEAVKEANEGVEDTNLRERNIRRAALDLYRSVDALREQPLKDDSGNVFTDPSIGWSLKDPEIIDCDVLVFATGFGEENPEAAALFSHIKWKNRNSDKKIDPNFDKPKTDEEILALVWENLAKGEESEYKSGHDYLAPDNKGYWESDNGDWRDSAGLDRKSGFGALKERLIESVNTAKAQGDLYEDAAQNQDDAMDRRTVIVSGSGDGALIDILRVCIKDFDHGAILNQLCSLVANDDDRFVSEIGHFSEMRPGTPSTLEAEEARTLGARLKQAAETLSKILKSEGFKFKESEHERINEIRNALYAFDIGGIFEELDIQLNNVMVYNVDRNPQPFATSAALLHKLLVFALFIRNKVRFFEGHIELPKNNEENPACVEIHRKSTGEVRTVHNPVGLIMRHGVEEQPGRFLKGVDTRSTHDDHIEGLLDESMATGPIIYNDGRRLIALLNLTNGLHPETYKFYNYTIRSLG